MRLFATEFTLALAGVDPGVLVVEALDHLGTTRMLLIEGLRLRDGTSTHGDNADGDGVEKLHDHVSLFRTP